MSLGSPAKPQDETHEQPNYSQRNQAHSEDNEDFHWSDGHDICLQPTGQIADCGPPSIAP